MASDISIRDYTTTAVNWRTYVRTYTPMTPEQLQKVLMELKTYLHTKTQQRVKWPS